MRLNGWQRIGVVASVAWAIAAYLYQMDQSARLASYLAGSEYSDCIADSVRKSLPDTDNCSKVLSDRLELYSRGSVTNAAVSALVPIPVGWLFVYITIWIGRWIKAGFAKGMKP